jgi:hypothetical protein
MALIDGVTVPPNRDSGRGGASVETVTVPQPTPAIPAAPVESAPPPAPPSPVGGWPAVPMLDPSRNAHTWSPPALGATPDSVAAGTVLRTVASIPLPTDEGGK